MYICMYVEGESQRKGHFCIFFQAPNKKSVTQKRHFCNVTGTFVTVQGTFVTVQGTLVTFRALL